LPKIKKKAAYDPVTTPVPEKFKRKTYAAHWEYKDINVKTIGYVARYEDEKGNKDVIPFFKQKNGKWVAGKIAGGKTPLYNLPGLSADTTSPVLVVEGEKTAEAAQRMIGSKGICTTWQGGSNAVKKSDWTHLRNRNVVIFPDADDAGKKAAMDVATEAKKAEAAKVTIVSPPDSVPKGWDLADAENEGWDSKKLAKWIRDHSEEDLKPVTIKNRPKIYIQDGDLHLMVDQAEEILTRAGDTIFQRGNQLVRIIKTDGGPLDPGTFIIERVDVNFFQDLMNREIEWLRKSASGEEWKPTNCPKSVPEKLLARVGFWKFPPLTAITHTPTLRADGSILDNPGYDIKSGIFFIPNGCDFKKIPEYPTRKEAEEAIKIILDAISTFPFLEEIDKAVAVAGFITPIIRRSIPTAPMIIYSAPLPGSGKSLLVNMHSIIINGKPVFVLSMGKNEEETEKRMGAALMQGDHLISLDNIDRRLKGDFLCQILTQQTVNIRILGQSKNVSLPMTSMIYGTGNDIVLSGDMPRRALVSILDPKCEKPEERVFKRDIISYTTEKRADLVRACLTIVRAYICAGEPDQHLTPYGSFDKWSKWVRSAIVWLGLEDPCLTKERIRDEDPVLADKRRLLHAWFDAFGEKALTLKDIIARVEGFGFDKREEQYDRDKIKNLRDILLDIAGTGNEKIDTRHLGNWIAKNKDQIVDGLKLQKNRIIHGAVKWKIVNFKDEKKADDDRDDSIELFGTL